MIKPNTNDYPIIYWDYRCRLAVANDAIELPAKPLSTYGYKNWFVKL